MQQVVRQQMFLVRASLHSIRKYAEALKLIRWILSRNVLYMEHNQGYLPTVIMVQNLRLAAGIVRAVMNNQIYYKVKFSLFISY